MEIITMQFFPVSSHFFPFRPI